MGGSRSTTVGGRAGGHGRLKDFPRGIEVLLKKATVDPGFRELLLRDPFAAADSIELSLQDSERRILVNTPESGACRHDPQHLRPQAARRQLPEAEGAGAPAPPGGLDGCSRRGGNQGSRSGPICIRQGRRDGQDGADPEGPRAVQDRARQLPDHEEWLSATNPLEGYIATTYLYDPWKRKFHYEGVETQAGAIDNYRLECLGENPDDPYDNIPSPMDSELHGFSDAG